MLDRGGTGAVDDDGTPVPPQAAVAVRCVHVRAVPPPVAVPLRRPPSRAFGSRGPGGDVRSPGAGATDAGSRPFGGPGTRPGASRGRCGPRWSATRTSGIWNWAATRLGGSAGAPGTRSRVCGTWRIRASVEVEATEEHVSVMLGHVPFRGVVDRLEREPDGLVVSDYKSGRAPAARHAPERLRQVLLYAAAIAEETGEQPVRAQLLYLGQRVVATARDDRRDQRRRRPIGVDLERHRRRLRRR